MINTQSQLSGEGLKQHVCHYDQVGDVYGEETKRKEAKTTQRTEETKEATSGNIFQILYTWKLQD